MNDISIIIRTKNSEQTIQTCLKKIKVQTIQPFEIIVIDSGSSDKTLKIVVEYGCKIYQYPYPVFNYSKSLNYGIKYAKGKYIMPISSHVILEHERTIEYMLHFLSSNSSVCAVSTYRKVHNNKQKQKWEDIDWFVFTRYNFKGMAMFNPCSMFEKRLWKEYPFNEQLPTAEDCDWINYFMKTYNYGAVVIYNPYILYKNPYNSMYKEHRELITIARHVYPSLLSFKNIIKMITIDSINAIINKDFYRVLSRYKLAFLFIKERLGFKMKITSSYNKKMS